MSELSSNYDRVAAFYEYASGVWSTGQIKAAKLKQLDWMQPESKVLYLGCGSGEDVLAAAAQGHAVGAVDISANMIQRLRHKLEKQKFSAELLCQSVFELDRDRQYDVVAANFFFNVFTGDSLQRVVEKALQLLKPDGQLLIADVALPTGSIPARVFNWCYINYAQLLAALGGLVKLHKNHDYTRLLEPTGWEIVERRDFRFLGKGPVLFQSLRVGKSAEQDSTGGSDGAVVPASRGASQPQGHSESRAARQAEGHAGQ